MWLTRNIRWIYTTIVSSHNLSVVSSGQNQVNLIFFFWNIVNLEEALGYWLVSEPCPGNTGNGFDFHRDLCMQLVEWWWKLLWYLREVFLSTLELEHIQAVKWGCAYCAFFALIHAVIVRIPMQPFLFGSLIVAYLLQYSPVLMINACWVLGGCWPSDQANWQAIYKCHALSTWNLNLYLSFGNQSWPDKIVFLCSV